MKAAMFLALTSLIASVAIAQNENLQPVHDYCGVVRDNGDTFQVIDGKYNPYLDSSAGTRFSDPKGVEDYLLKHGVKEDCYCITGVTERYDRAGSAAYEFRKLVGLKSCRTIID